MINIYANYILIIDFGSQYTQLIARRVREAGIYCKISPWDDCEKIINDTNLVGIILSGGPETVTSSAVPVAPEKIFNLGIPILGICYGMQTMAVQLNGRVVNSNNHEYGYTQVYICSQSRLLHNVKDNHRTNNSGVYDTIDVWMSHSDKVEVLPEGFKIICKTNNGSIAGIANELHHYYGLQFHPEVTHTLQGNRILKNFLFHICQCQTLWNTSNIIENIISKIRKEVGTKKVILGLSGGVDSFILGALLHQAIGRNQLNCVFVDNGLLRLHEGDQVMKIFSKYLGIKVIRINAEDRFLAALKGQTDPEKKRKIIGKLFISIFEEEASKLIDIDYLAQGTIYPDIIESAVRSSNAHVIKSHHNVGGLPKHMKLKLIEPLSELFKDEVRRIGIELGLSKEIIQRHPFPGPGLSIRILGEVRKKYINILRLADHIYIQELHKAGLYDKVSQAFAAFLPIKSVGIIGDTRCYEYVVVLRAVKTIDFMTASLVHLSFKFLEIVSRRIINEVPGISRVVYDISSKPPATIEWE